MFFSHCSRTVSSVVPLPHPKIIRVPSKSHWSVSARLLLAASAAADNDNR